MHADSLCPDTCPCVSQSLGQEPVFSNNDYDSTDTWTEIFDKVPFSKAPGKNMSVHDILEYVKAEVDPKIPYETKMEFIDESGERLLVNKPRKRRLVGRRLPWVESCYKALENFLGRKKQDKHGGRSWLYEGFTMDGLQSGEAETQADRKRKKISPPEIGGTTCWTQRDFDMYRNEPEYGPKLLQVYEKRKYEGDMWYKCRLQRPGCKLYIRWVKVDWADLLYGIINVHAMLSQLNTEPEPEELHGIKCWTSSDFNKYADIDPQQFRLEKAIGRCESKGITYYKFTLYLPNENDGSSTRETHWIRDKFYSLLHTPTQDKDKDNFGPVVTKESLMDLDVKDWTFRTVESYLRQWGDHYAPTLVEIIDGKRFENGINLSLRYKCKLKNNFSTDNSQVAIVWVGCNDMGYFRNDINSKYDGKGITAEALEQFNFPKCGFFDDLPGIPLSALTTEDLERLGLGLVERFS